MALISQLSVGLTANTRGLEKGFNKAKRKARELKSSFFNLKTGLVGALGVLGGGALLSSSIKAFRTQEQAVAALDATNRTVGRSTAGLTQSMIKMAQQMQREGIIGDEVILQGMRILSTYSQIPDELMPRASRAMVDMMAQFGMSGQSAANLIGRAAMGEASAMKRVGITLSGATQNAVKDQQKIMRAADAAGISIDTLNGNSRIFSMILGDIEGQVGGVNKALGATDSGAFDQLGNSIGDLKEKIGEVVTSGLGQWVREISRLIDNSGLSVDELAQSFRNWVADTLQSMAPIVNFFKTINLMWKTLKLGFLGFATLVSGTLKNLFGLIAKVGNTLGLDVGSGVFHHFEINKEIHAKNMARIRELKSEISTLATDINQNKFGTEFAEGFRKFRDRAAANEAAALSKPAPAQPERAGRIDKLIINPGSTEIRGMGIPQLDKTNELLGQMLRNQALNPVAVAG